MNEVMTMDEIKSRFDSEWVLIDNPEIAETTHIAGGKVIAHGKGRSEISRKAQELPAPRNIAIIFIGQIPKGTAVML